MKNLHNQHCKRWGQPGRASSFGLGECSYGLQPEATGAIPQAILAVNLLGVFQTRCPKNREDVLSKKMLIVGGEWIMIILDCTVLDEKQL